MAGTTCLFPKLTATTQEQLATLLTIMLVRAIHDFVGEPGYSSILIPALWAQHMCSYCYVGLSPSQPMSAVDVCRSMKLNLFPHDKSTKLIANILKCTSRKGGRRTINTYMMTRCTSYEFLAAFLATGTHRLKTLRGKIRGMMKHFGVDGLHKCFTRSFQPQRRIRNSLLKLRRAGKHLAMKKMFKSQFVAPAQLKLKSGKQFRNKLDICRDIRSMYGLGVFGSKNYWQYYKLAATYPARKDCVYGEARWQVF